MTLLDSTTLTSELADAVRGKLQNAPVPLKLAEIVKGLPKPRRTKAAELQNEVRSILDEQVRIGAIFRCPSGKNGETRFWSRDEKHLLREKAMELAATPQSVVVLKKALAKEVKGSDAAFVESLLREMIGEAKLFERPAKTARIGPLFSATPPPPPLAQPKYATKVNKLVADCQKLRAVAKVSVEELLQTLQTRLHQATVMEPRAASSEPTGTPVEEPMSAPSAAPPTSAHAELEDVLLKALDHAPVLSLAELRAGMPAEYRGPAFDEAILRLADEQQVILSQDADPSRFSDAEKAEYVRDGEALFTTIARRSFRVE